MNVTCVLIFDGSSLGCKSNAGQRLQKAAPIKLFFSHFLPIGNFHQKSGIKRWPNGCWCHRAGKAKMKTKKSKTKKSIKKIRVGGKPVRVRFDTKARTKSNSLIAASRFGCPGIDMFRLDQLKPAGYNPRVIAAEALEGLMNSINRFGCVEPIVGQSSKRAATFRCHSPCERRPQSNWSYKT